MKYLPAVVKAEYLDGFVIDLTFDDGTRAAVDFSVWLEGGIFESLKKKSQFKKFFIDGNTVAWSNGADVAPETLYEAAVAANRSIKSNELTTGKKRKSA